MVVEGQPNISGAVADRSPDHAVPLTPEATDPARQHAGNPAREIGTVGRDLLADRQPSRRASEETTAAPTSSPKRCRIRADPGIPALIRIEGRGWHDRRGATGRD